MRTIESPRANPQNFHPLVGLRAIGNYVKGKVLEKGTTANQNPVIAISLIELDGSTSKAVSKGVYQEVDVAEGDTVQIIGNLKDLKDKLPQLEIGDVVTITYKNDVPTKRGRAMHIFEVKVD
jgi:hypothetical protein